MAVVERNSQKVLDHITVTLHEEGAKRVVSTAEAEQTLQQFFSRKKGVFWVVHNKLQFKAEFLSADQLQIQTLIRRKNFTSKDLNYANLLSEWNNFRVLLALTDLESNDPLKRIKRFIDKFLITATLILVLLKIIIQLSSSSAPELSVKLFIIPIFGLVLSSIGLQVALLYRHQGLKDMTVRTFVMFVLVLALAIYIITQ